YWISQDLAPVETAAKAFMDTLARVVQTTDSTTTPTAIPPTQGDPKQSTQGANAVTSLFGSLGFSNYLLSSITNYLLPQTQVWTDPFGSLMGLGQFLVNASLIAFGTSALLASTSITTAGAIWNFLTGNWGAAVDAGAHDCRRRWPARPRHRGLGPLVQRRLSPQPDGDRPLPRLLRLRLHVLADPRKLRHRRRLRAARRL